LLSGELAYAGVGRTLVCSLLETAPFRKMNCAIAREFCHDARRLPHPRQFACLVPARGGSKDVLRKNIRLLGGKPLVAHACCCGVESKLVTRTIVSTDSPEIAQAAVAAGAEAPFLRPAEYAR
jgi:hypothetical protein